MDNIVTFKQTKKNLKLICYCQFLIISFSDLPSFNNSKILSYADENYASNSSFNRMKNRNT